MSLSNLLLLPLLTLISIPLILSACITITLAFLTLWIRVIIVYVELALALFVNFFFWDPAEEHSSGRGFPSLLTFSGANTPGLAVAGGHAVTGGSGRPLRSKSRVRLVDEAEGYFVHAHGHVHPHHHDKLRTPPSPRSSQEQQPLFFHLVSSGDNPERDFEGVGGWRTPLPPRHKRKGGTTATTSSSSSINSLNLNFSLGSGGGGGDSDGEGGIDGDLHDYIYDDADDAHHDNDNHEDDEQAWLSINSRLELPSSSSSSSRLVSRKGGLLALNTSRSTSPSLRRNKSRTGPEPESERLRRQQHQYPQRPGYHRRSLTTPFPLIPWNLPMTMTTTSTRTTAAGGTTAGREGFNSQEQRPTPPHRSSSS